MKRTIKEVVELLKTEGTLIGFIFRTKSIFEQEVKEGMPDTEGVHLIFIENKENFTKEDLYHFGCIDLPQEFNLDVTKIVKKQLSQNNISDKKRFQVFKRDNFKCQYCGRSQQEGAVLEIDHIIPKSKGGTDDIDNLITSCRECNRGKGNHSLDEY